MSAGLSTLEHEITTWSPELFLLMDWRRFQELVRTLMHYNGFTVVDYKIHRDAGATLLVTTGNPEDGGSSSLVEVAPWEHSFVESDELVRFTHRAVRGDTRKIYVTPGSFSGDARECARMNGIELVDGSYLLSMLGSVSDEQGHYLFKMATVGEFNYPSCPFCAKKLDLAPKPCEKLPDPDEGTRLLKYSGKEVVNEDVVCYRLRIKKGAEIHFLRSVTTAHAEIFGRVTGNFTCLESMRIGPSAVVTGMVAAKSLQLDEGAVMDGTTDICDARLARPIEPVPEEEAWRCLDATTPHCERVELQPRLITLPAD